MEHLTLLIVWGVLVGLDLVSVPQVMIARPLVAGTVAGVIVGDPVAGATVGIVLELFALGVLPVGAVRYPDLGLGTIAATVAAAGAPSIFGTGLGVGIGLLVAYLGGMGIHAVRILTARDVRRHQTALDRGDRRMVISVHLRGLGRDALRSLAITGLGIALAMTARNWLPLTTRGAVYLGIVAVGGALAASMEGVYQLVGRRVVLRWFALGLAGGLMGVVALS
ncbi:MAG: PTS sugar transporter subunit IIC [Gemmatimonadales bacterium]